MISTDTVAFGLSSELLENDPILRHEHLKNKTNFSIGSLPKGVKCDLCTIQHGLLYDCLNVGGKNTIELAKYIDQKWDAPNDPDYDLARYKKNKKKYDGLLKSIKNESRLGKKFRPPILLKTPNEMFARLDGKHRLGFLIYLGIQETELIVVDLPDCDLYSPDEIVAIERHLSNKSN